jgi:hypothetical protein
MMKTTKNRTYTKPQVKRTKIDNEISMVMMSPFGPGGDPSGSLKLLNPLKWWR